MKTFIITQSLKARQILIMLCISFIALTGCKKEEMPEVKADNNQHNELREGHLTTPYTMLVIEHNNSGSSLPDYDVYLRSDGTGTYRGWSNVACLGPHEFKTDAATVSYIKNLFESANFFNIQLIATHYNDPYTATTYNSTFAIKRLIDYDQGIPQILIQIRKRAEEKLDIARFVEFKKYTVPDSDL